MAAANFSDGALNSLWQYGILSLFTEGILELRNGIQPVNANLAPTGDVLLKIYLPSDPFSVVDLNTVMLNGSWVSSISDVIIPGTPTWARLKLPIDSNLDDLLSVYSRVDCAIPSVMTINPTTVDLNTVVTVQSFTIVRI
jgi:hypothetical protein